MVYSNVIILGLSNCVIVSSSLTASLVTFPIVKSPVAATSNKHNMSLPQI